MIIGLILHGRPTVMRRLLIRSKRRVLIASDYLERALAPGRASTRQSWQGATDRDRSRLLVPCREVVSRNRNERSGCSRVDTGNWARTGRDRAPGRASTRQSWQGATDRDRSRLLVPCREVVSRNRNERSGCSRVDTGNWARTGRDRSRPVRKSVVWTRP